jgi:lysophospholipase L1-like esterase
MPPRQPKILLLGDSQRGRYQARVAELLAGRAEVCGPAENGRFSLYTLMRLPIWLAELGTPDIVHWNNGLWDLGDIETRGPSQFSLPDYLTNLRNILALLRKTGARIVWATSTPVPTTRPRKPAGWLWKMDDIVRYNAASCELMRSEGVPINDLFELIVPDMPRLLDDGMCHLSAEGVEVAARAVVTAIEREIAALSSSALISHESPSARLVEAPIEGTLTGGAMPGQGPVFKG